MAVAVPIMDNSSTNTTAYASDARQAPYELVRSDRYEQLIRRMSFPESYVSNSKRESSCLLFVETFRSQFAQLFPSRPPLLLSPLNECNTQKFISSFVRPTQLKYEELYDYDTTAKFVANFVVYEPLEEMERVPSRIVSPATVLEWQVANSIELSVTLCSLLCGSGYNAYVVVGRAAREVVECDRSQVPWDGSLPVEVNSDDDEPPPEPRNNRFWKIMKHRPGLQSEFDAEQAKDGVDDELYMMARGRMSDQTLRGTMTFAGGGATTTAGGGGGTSNFGSGDALDETASAGGHHHQHHLGGTSGLNQSGGPDQHNNESGDGGGRDGGDGDQQQQNGAERNISPLVHAWVVILPSGNAVSKKRPVDSIVCIEPSTGLTFPLEDTNYHAVETVFNHINCFVNTKPDARPSELSWNMYDLAEWESVFLSDFEIVQTTSYQRDSDTGAGSSSHRGGGGGGSGGGLHSSTGDGKGGGGGGSGGGGGDGKGSGGSGPLADLSAAIANASWAPNDGGDLSLDLPASWVAPLTLSPAQFANRFPTRSATVRYCDARVTRFAEYADPHLRVLEVRVQDDVDPRAEQVHTFYKHRHDLLRRKSLYPALEVKAGQDRLDEPRKIHEWFSPGRKAESRVEGLRELITERGKHRTMRFFWRSRDDGLARRVELWNEGDRSPNPLPRKIIEEYKGRESTDCLTWRSATFKSIQMHHQHGGSAGGAGGAGGIYGGMQLAGAVAAAAAAGLSSSGSGGGASSSLGAAGDKDSVASRPPERMAEKYCRNAKQQAAENDVAKLKFLKPLSSDGEIWVHYHYPKDCITFPYRLFPKAVERDRADSSSGVGSQSTFSDPSTAPLVVTAPFQDKPREPELREQLRKLLSREKECLNEIRSKMDECHVILDQRQKDVQLLQPILSAYDTLRNRSRETDTEREAKRLEELRRAQSRNDYLAPYIAALDLERNLRGVDLSTVRLSVENAKLVRDSALKDLKDRLIQRGHIMQARLDQEKEELYRRQAAFQKNLDASNEGAADSEAFAKFCSDAAWRMKILDERLSRHIEDAGNRYAALARKLSEDPRLAALYEAH